MEIFRRKFLRKITLSTLGLMTVSIRSLAKKTCATGSDIEGPFYRKKAPQRNELAKAYTEKGEVLLVTGIVYAEDCKKRLVNATIDIWHASPKGQYDNDSNKFMFRGQVITNEHGAYSYETLLPGFYSSRPRHIHYKVRHSDYRELTTQLYFQGDKYLSTDRTAQRNNGLDRAMPYHKSQNGHYELSFDIYLNH